MTSDKDLQQQLTTANLELIFQNQEKEKRAAELVIANTELAFQNAAKEKLAEELIIANIELVHQNKEKEKRAAELITANIELAFQNEEKEKRAAELAIANAELAFQNEKKEKLAEELIIANIELVHQNNEKEKRAAELITANIELAFQNEEKEKRAAELVIANTELVHQNNEKEKRAAELITANIELAFQNEEKEKRAAELLFANQELETFTFISSHDLQEPLRKIQFFARMVIDKEKESLTTDSTAHLKRITTAAWRMQGLIESLLVYSNSNLSEQSFQMVGLDEMFHEVEKDFTEIILEKKAVIKNDMTGKALVNAFQFRLLIWHLLDNALKFCHPDIAPQITVISRIGSGSSLQKQNPTLTDGQLSPEKKYYHICFSDNGIGFEALYKDKIFEIFQRLHPKEMYTGAGIGLPIVKKILLNHKGVITATGELDKGAVFDIYIPVPVTDVDM